MVRLDFEFRAVKLWHGVPIPIEFVVSFSGLGLCGQAIFAWVLVYSI